jgi:hypothetical protein
MGSENAQVSPLLAFVGIGGLCLRPLFFSFLAIALGSEFVMSAILGLSAFHLGSLTRNSDTKQLAFRHKATALQGLQTALGSFSKANCDAILAASVLLSWQATEQ